MNFLALRWLSACIEKNCVIEYGMQYKLKDCPRSQCKNTSAEKYIADESDIIQSDKTITQHFVCAYSSDDPSNSLNLNGSIIEELSKLATAYKNSNDQWRCFAYEKALSAIKKHPKTIHSRKGKTNGLVKMRKRPS